MELDSLDLQIIKTLKEGIPLTSYNITKEIFDEDYKKLRCKANTIKYRLEKLYKNKIVYKSKETDKNFYNLNTDIVRLRKKAKISSGNIVLEVYDVVFIKIGKGDWAFYQIKT